MKCYNHPEADAVAMCKNCGRALCINCAVDVSNRMACKDKCENEVKALTEILSRRKKASQNELYLSKANMYTIFSASFLGAGIISIIVSDSHGGFILLLIGIISVIATASYIRKHQS